MGNMPIIALQDPFTTEAEVAFRDEALEKLYQYKDGRWLSGKLAFAHNGVHTGRDPTCMIAQYPNGTWSGLKMYGKWHGYPIKQEPGWVLDQAGRWFVLLKSIVEENEEFEVVNLPNHPNC